jgi:hypothetical protein
MQPPTGVVRGTLDPDPELAKGLHGLLRQPVTRPPEGLLPCQNLHPGDVARLTVGALHGLIDHPHRGPPDVRPGAIPFDKGNNGAVGNLETTEKRDLFSLWWDLGVVGAQHAAPLP